MQFAETNVLIAQMQNDEEEVDGLLNEFYKRELEEFLEDLEELSSNIRGRLADGNYNG